MATPTLSEQFTLERFERVWQLSSAQAAAVFGVSRQAYAKWHRDRIPPERQADVRLVDEATQTLVDRVKVDRIPAVVRRASAELGGDTFLGIARAGDLARLRDEIARTFDLRRDELFDLDHDQSGSMEDEKREGYF